MYKFPAVYLLLGNGLNGRESQEPGREKKKTTFGSVSAPFPRQERADRERAKIRICRLIVPPYPRVR